MMVMYIYRIEISTLMTINTTRKTKMDITTKTGIGLKMNTKMMKMVVTAGTTTTNMMDTTMTNTMTNTTMLTTTTMIMIIITVGIKVSFVAIVDTMNPFVLMTMVAIGRKEVAMAIGRMEAAVIG